MDMDQRDARIAELEDQLGKERAYSEVLEAFFQERLITALESITDERMQGMAELVVDRRLGWNDGFLWTVFKQRFNPSMVEGMHGFNIDDMLTQFDNRLAALEVLAMTEPKKDDETE